jgi:hypothetical protein
MSEETRYWDGWKSYKLLSEFSNLQLAIRAAEPAGWARRHPPEPLTHDEPGPSDDAYHERGPYGGHAASD